MSIEETINEIYKLMQGIFAISVIFVAALFMTLICVFIYYCRLEEEAKEDKLIERIKKEVKNNGKS